ncbi:hypothetical protein PYCCODRAFT_1460517 [Trametes coccinea BRFM310]|uniref:Uncharacterized protein n=1 Tax=Trametes coccinea (strain BRFM310) TaxID=1353009 RepID=A0A1Y2IJ25_TRAC3|nr:hypothetical protein PYCCODRAFT_1460517 [Trametes coccinea BRFM310]
MSPSCSYLPADCPASFDDDLSSLHGYCETYSDPGVGAWDVSLHTASAYGPQWPSPQTLSPHEAELQNNYLDTQFTPLPALMDDMLLAHSTHDVPPADPWTITQGAEALDFYAQCSLPLRAAKVLLPRILILLVARTVARRNAPAPLTAHHLRSPSTNRWACPHCPYVQTTRRSPDLKRHMKTHFPSGTSDEAEWICCGVPLEDAQAMGVPREVLLEEAFIYGGEAMVGGCRKVFSRRDALKRHLVKRKGFCYGDALASYLQGNKIGSSIAWILMDYGQ